MTDKIFIAKGELSGNLKEHKQTYYVDYMPEVYKDGKLLYTDKVEIALVVPSEKGDGESIYRSIRTNDPAQLYLLIIDLLKAFAYFKKAKGELSTFNMNYYQADLSRKFLQIEKDTIKGEQR